LPGAGVYSNFRVRDRTTGSIQVLIDTIDICRSALLLDVDGTLLDIAATPRAVEVPPGLITALRRLCEQTQGATAFVSGRPLAELDRLFDPLRLPAVAGHGAELRLTEGGELCRHAARIGGDVRVRFADFIKSHEGIFLEDKGYSLALHYRLAPQYEASVWQTVTEACAPYLSNSIEILPGKEVIEVKSTGFDKGSGIRELMKHPPFHGRRPVFVGDDVTDHAGFAVLPEFDGLGFSVGMKFAELAGSFPAPRDVRQWLYRAAGMDGAAGS
jgi:trehalose 6-phosphate phosphatase